MEVPVTARKFKCPVCGVPVTTTDRRKMFCTKQCADRSRNTGPSPSNPGGIITDLKQFSKLDEPAKARVLLGKEQFTVVGFDLECTSLKPNVGRILCASFKTIGKDPYTFSALDRRFFERDVYDDGKLAKAIRDELEKYDIITGWNSKQFDVKFLNSRLIHAGHRTKKAQPHVDGMWGFRSKASAWSGLKAVQEYILPGGVEKTRVVWEQWMRALGWDKKLREEAMDEIIEHCELDVIVLENVYRKLVEADFVRSIRRDGGIL
jgi:uncharacterized protein YprB with RNaseH-like and TPR domain